MSSMIQFAEIVLRHDVTAPAKLANHIAEMQAANDDSFDWQAEQANDPGYEEWLEEQAFNEDMRNARW